MGLNIGMVRAEQLSCAFPRKLLHFVNILAAAVIPGGRIPFGILVCQMAPDGLHDRLTDKVFGGDQLQMIALA